MPSEQTPASEHDAPVVDYASPPPDRRLSRPSRLILWGTLILVGGFLAFGFLMPFLNRRHPDVNYRLACQRNMREIAMGIVVYANDHGGKFPDDLETVLANEDLDARVFVCPLSRDTPAPAGPTTQATAAGLRQPGHCSYIYLGKGLTDRTVTPDTVLLYEPLADHGGDGINVVFGDLHTEWVPASTAQTILTQHAASTQPIRLKTDSSSP
jgi:hypothetical protein